MWFSYVTEHCGQLTNNVQKQKIVSTKDTQNLFLIIKCAGTFEPGWRLGSAGTKGKATQSKIQSVHSVMPRIELLR